MITRALTPNLDWTYGNGQQNYLLGEAAIEQNVVTTALSWVGDCYYSLYFGVDWYNRLDVGQQNNLVQELKQVIAGCYGIVGVTSTASEFDGATRLEQIQMQIATIFEPKIPITIPVPSQQGT